MIRIKRDSGYADRFREYKVMLDDNIIGSIKNGAVQTLEVPPGKHRLQLKLDWCRSNTVEFETNSNVVDFECGSNVRGIKIFYWFAYISFLCNEYMWLKMIK